MAFETGLDARRHVPLERQSALDPCARAPPPRGCSTGELASPYRRREATHRRPSRPVLCRTYLPPLARIRSAQWRERPAAPFTRHGRHATFKHRRSPCHQCPGSKPVVLILNAVASLSPRPATKRPLRQVSLPPNLKFQSRFSIDELTSSSCSPAKSSVPQPSPSNIPHPKLLHFLGSFLDHSSTPAVHPTGQNQSFPQTSRSFQPLSILHRGAPSFGGPRPQMEPQ